jgi:hypothetical protein
MRPRRVRFTTHGGYFIPDERIRQLRLPRIRRAQQPNPQASLLTTRIDRCARRNVYTVILTPRTVI